MKLRHFLLLSLLLPLISYAKKPQENIVRVFFLGGQSNMVGQGYNKDLPDSLDKAIDNVWIFHGNTARDGEMNGGIGVWEQVKPGHGRFFSSDGTTNNLSNRFGVEVSFAKKLERLYPGETIAIIKYARGGTSIDSAAARNFGCWEPDFTSKGGINQYDHCLKTIAEALAIDDINNDGIRDILIPNGIIWMQGESDADFSEEIALHYYDNLKRLMDLIRAALRIDDLPVVIGKISDSWNDKDGKVWDYGELVQYAEEKFARTDANAAIVKSTRYYLYSDPWHYDSQGYIDLGERFAEAVYELNKE